MPKGLTAISAILVPACSTSYWTRLAYLRRYEINGINYDDQYDIASY